MISFSVAKVASGRRAFCCTTKTGCVVVGRTTRVGAVRGGEANAISVPVGLVEAAYPCSAAGVEAEGGALHGATGWVVPPRSVTRCGIVQPQSTGGG